jgi:hypothetical protein
MSFGDNDQRRTPAPRHDEKSAGLRSLKNVAEDRRLRNHGRIKKRPSLPRCRRGSAMVFRDGAMV